MTTTTLTWKDTNREKTTHNDEVWMLVREKSTGHESVQVGHDWGRGLQPRGWHISDAKFTAEYEVITYAILPTAAEVRAAIAEPEVPEGVTVFDTMDGFYTVIFPNMQTFRLQGTIGNYHWFDCGIGVWSPDEFWRTCHGYHRLRKDKAAAFLKGKPKLPGVRK